MFNYQYMFTSLFRWKTFLRAILKKGVKFDVQMIAPFCLPLLAGIFLSDVLCEEYLKQTNEGKLTIALFAPLLGVAVKVISRICVQRLWNISHPGYSYVLLAPLHYCTAVIFRVLQADLDDLQSTDCRT